MIIKSKFKSAWWLPTGHLQTVAPMLLPHDSIETLPEDLDLPDGDFLELAWTELPDLANPKPIIIVLHGIEGSVESHYAKTILSAIKKQGWIGLFKHFRGCGKKPNLKAECYHSGRTDDLNYLIDYISDRYPEAPLGAIGFSLGGNVLSKLLGESKHAKLKAGVVVCAPLKLSVSADSINHGFSKLYQNYLLNALKTHLKKKIKAKTLPDITEEQIDQIRTLRDFDHLYTVPVHGFLSVDDYYQQNSGWHYLKGIKTPTLVLHANDDPFINLSVVPSEVEISEKVVFEVSRRGGHIGFVSGSNPLKPKYWFAQRSISFLNDHLFEDASASASDQVMPTYLHELLHAIKHRCFQPITRFLR